MTLLPSSIGQQIIFRGIAANDAALGATFTTSATAINTPLQNGRVMREFWFPGTTALTSTTSKQNILVMDSPALSPTNPIFPLPQPIGTMPEYVPLYRGSSQAPTENALIDEFGGGGVGNAYTRVYLNSTVSNTNMSKFKLTGFYAF